LFSSQPTNQLLTLYILLLMEISIFLQRGYFCGPLTREDPNTTDDRIGF
jgi:hypothetical protein